MDERLAAISRESRDALTLVLVLAQYSPSAPTLLGLLRRGVVDRIGHDRNGNQCQVSPKSSGVPFEVIELIRHDERLSQALHYLQSPAEGALIVQEDGHGYQSVVLSPELRRLAERELVRRADGSRLSYETGIRMVAHAFPRSILDSTSMNHCDSYVAQAEFFTGLLEASLQTGEDVSSKTAAAATSLFMSVYHLAGSVELRERLVQVSEVLMFKMDPAVDPSKPLPPAEYDYDFLVAFATERRGRLCLSRDQTEEGVSILRQFALWSRPDLAPLAGPSAHVSAHAPPFMSRLTNAMHGRVFVMLSKGLLAAGRVYEAEQFLVAWQRPEPLSTAERAIGWIRDSGLGDVYAAREEWSRAEAMVEAMVRDITVDMERVSKAGGPVSKVWDEVVHQVDERKARREASIRRCKKERLMKRSST